MTDKEKLLAIVANSLGEMITDVFSTVTDLMLGDEENPDKVKNIIREKINVFKTDIGNLVTDLDTMTLQELSEKYVFD